MVYFLHFYVHGIYKTIKIKQLNKDEICANEIDNQSNCDFIQIAEAPIENTKPLGKKSKKVSSNESLNSNVSAKSGTSVKKNEKNNTTLSKSSATTPSPVAATTPSTKKTISSQSSKNSAPPNAKPETSLKPKQNANATKNRTNTATPTNRNTNASTKKSGKSISETTKYGNNKNLKCVQQQSNVEKYSVVGLGLFLFLVLSGVLFFIDSSHFF